MSEEQTLPERIWIQPGQAIDPAECTLSHVGTERVTSADVEYVRADRARSSEDRSPLSEEKAKQRAREIVDSINEEHDVAPSDDSSPWAEYDRSMVDRIATELLRVSKEGK